MYLFGICIRKCWVSGLVCIMITLLWICIFNYIVFQCYVTRRQIWNGLWWGPYSPHIVSCPCFTDYFNEDRTYYTEYSLNSNFDIWRGMGIHKKPYVGIRGSLFDACKRLWITLIGSRKIAGFKQLDFVKQANKQIRPFTVGHDLIYNCSSCHFLFGSAIKRCWILE